MNGIDRSYFLERAEEELRSGEQARSKAAADAHFELAGRYFDLAHGGAEGIDTVRNTPQDGGALPIVTQSGARRANAH